jgi:hypothetical protein
MTAFIDTEGHDIPVDDVGEHPFFDVDLCDWNEGDGPELTMNVPAFETETDSYAGGIVFVPLKNVLEQYLRTFLQTDGGGGRVEFVAWLRDYAARLEAAA